MNVYGHAEQSGNPKNDFDLHRRAEAAQYRETLAIERSLAENRPEGQEWLNAQMEISPEPSVLDSKSAEA